MVKGITLCLLLVASSSAFAGKEVVNSLISKCKSLGGSYSAPAVDDPSGERRECYQVRCSLSENADDMTVAALEAAFPEGGGEGGFIGGWKLHCYDRRGSDEAIKDAVGGEFEIDGHGTVDWDVFSAICGEDRSRCTLKGGVWFPDFDWGSDGSSNGSNGKHGNSSNCRVVKYGPRNSLERTVCDGNGKNGSNGSSNGSSNGNNGRSDGYVHWEGNTKFWCPYYMDIEECIGDEANIIISASGDARNCVDCSTGSNRGGMYGTLSGIAEIAGAVLPPVMGYLGVKAGADAYLGANQAWAGAAATGFEQCQIMQTNYINGYYTDVQAQRDYVVQNELANQTFGGNMNVPGCSGYQLGAFAGTGSWMGNGMGSFGSPWGSGGYSNGFMGGMYGPYGMYSPYGSVIGMSGMNGMSSNPYGMYGMSGMNGMNGMGLGLNIGLGLGNGMNGMNGYPYGMNGMSGGYPYGLNGGLNIGLGLGNGMNGYPYGMNGMTNPYFGGNNMYGNGMNGLNGGFNIGLGLGNGMNGMNGMYGNPYYGGATGQGLVPWNNGAGSYWNGSGGWNNGSNGNYNGNYANWNNISQSYAQNQQAYMQGSYLQQASLQNQYNQSAQNLWSNGYNYNGMNSMYGNNYGYAPYSPSNIGFSLNAGWGFGF